jgi:hypothetical protein
MLRRTVARAHLSPMKGRSQPHLFWCDNRSYYVVKFRENPEGPRLLINELLGTLLAKDLGLTVPRIALVDVPDDVIRGSWNLCIKLPFTRIKPKPGLAFGSEHLGVRTMRRTRYAGIFDTLPDSLGLVENLAEFAGILVFDLWTCNVECRQILFGPRRRLAGWGVTMVDNGHCFGGIGWKLDDSVMRGIFARQDVYRDVVGPSSFEPWLSRLETKIDRATVQDAISKIPDGWRDRDSPALTRLADNLDQRRKSVRELLYLARKSSPELFPHWHRPTTVAAAFKEAMA